MPTAPLDTIDSRIVDALQRDGRLTNLELADRIGLSPSPCLRRVRRLEAEGFISGYRATLSRQRVGLGLMVFVSMKIERHRDAEANEFMKAVQALPEVVSCYIISGEHDFLLQVVVPDLAAYRQFTLEKLLRLPGVRDMQSSFAIDTVKENAPLPLTHLTRPQKKRRGG
jgi:Lrp/AsnC family transcriptional regulator, leucine-responsive regulatory protein